MDLFKPRLGGPHHLAYLVEDIEETAIRLARQLGAGPFFLVENVPLEEVRSRGEPAALAHHSAFGSCDTGAIELIQIIGIAPGRVERRFSGPRPRLHHVAHLAPAAQVAELRDSLEERGLPQYLSARLGEVDNTFHDASATLGHDIEVHVDCQGLRDFFQMVGGAAEGWDGSDPLRPVPG
jgi:hypothetical protein